MINISVVVECKILDQLPKAEIQRTGAIDLLKQEESARERALCQLTECF